MFGPCYRTLVSDFLSMFLCVYVRASSICIQARARARVDILNVFTAFVHVHCVFTALFCNEMFIDCLNCGNY